MQETLILEKMPHSGDGLLKYQLGNVPVSELVGSKVNLKFTGKIFCVECGRAIKKTFDQGYCFPCFRKLAACDTCIVRPELCHFHKGTCREPEWGKTHCLIEHVVYAANSCGLKVGVTRAHQMRTRWGDQGATEAIILARLPERLVAGNLEVLLKAHAGDKTNWRGLLTGLNVDVDLLAAKTELLQHFSVEFEARKDPDNTIYKFSYPVLNYLNKAKTINLDKEAEHSGVLSGIRGQYLFIGEAGLNVRSWQGYEVTLEF